jgi:Dockerin type I domain
MKNAHTFKFAVLTFVLLMIGTSVMARYFGGPDDILDLSWNTVDGGGGTSTGGSYVLGGTIGQPDAASMSGGTFALAGGFWPAVVQSCPADIAPTGGDGLINIDDLLLVINGWGNCPTPPTPCPADVNASGAVNIDDLLAVINAWGACP